MHIHDEGGTGGRPKFEVNILRLPLILINGFLPILLCQLRDVEALLWQHGNPVLYLAEIPDVILTGDFFCRVCIRR